MLLRATLVALLIVLATAPAFACKVCDGNGCKNASATETGRSDCTATATSCTISGTTCHSGGGSGCECGTMGCSPCNGTCFEVPFADEQWELASIQVIPAAPRSADWILVEIQAIPAPVR